MFTFGDSMEMYNSIINLDWNKYAWLIAAITGIIIIAGCIFISISKTLPARVIGTLLAISATSWFVPAIYKLFNTGASIEQIKHINTFTSFVSGGMLLPMLFLLSLHPSKVEVETIISEYIERLKRLSEAATSGTSTPKQLSEWREVIKVLFTCESGEVPPEVLKDATRTFPIYLGKHYPGVSDEEALDESKNRPKNDYSPLYIHDRDLDTKPSCIVQLIASVLLFFLGYFYSVQAISPEVGYVLAMPLALMMGYISSTLVSGIYYAYVYLSKFFHDKENVRNVFAKILVLIAGISVLVIVLLIMITILHPFRVYKALKVVFQKQ
jgi:hypothetical protein